MNSAIRTAIICAADHVLPRLPVVLLRGASGSLLVAGTERWSRYLPERFFGDDSHTHERLGVWPVWRLPGVLAAWRSRVDAVVARVDLFSTAWFSDHEYVRVPEWVRMIATVPRAEEPRASSQARRNSQLARRHGLVWRVSRNPRDLETFIERDYRPYIRTRHGGDAHLRSTRWFRHRLRDGGLVWIEREGQPVAGFTYDLRAPVLRRLTGACARGDAGLLRIGAMSATYQACFEMAPALDCTEVDLRNCRPCLADGLMRVKQSWGGRLAEPDDLTHDLLLGWSKASPAVLRFLSASPLIVRDNGGFSILCGNQADLAIRDGFPGSRRLMMPQPDSSFGEWTMCALRP
jgi:hypothetical protein